LFFYDGSDKGGFGFISALDNTLGACAAAGADRPEIAVQTAVDGLTLTPLANGTYSLDLRARCRRGPLSQRAKTACKKDAGMSVPWSVIALAEPFRTYHMRYNFDGVTFLLDPSSVAEQRAYDACSAQP
jgi:hypothetical protein